jgi:hypothetical protein
MKPTFLFTTRFHRPFLAKVYCCQKGWFSSEVGSESGSGPTPSGSAILQIFKMSDSDPDLHLTQWHLITQMSTFKVISKIAFDLKKKTSVNDEIVLMAQPYIVLLYYLHKKIFYSYPD